jgi:ketosteroid isomerase-like protein
MKTLFILSLILSMCVGTIAQEINPIYGLAVCVTDYSTTHETSSLPETGKQTIAVDDEAGFKEFLTRFEKGLNDFINGDASLWKQHVSRSEHVTIMGGFGAYEKGWQQVGPRYDWASERFEPSGAKAQFEYLSMAVSGELAYTVAIERSKVRFADTGKAEPMTLRATHIFKKENGEWKLLHRHADFLMEKTTPGSAKKK